MDKQMDPVATRVLAAALALALAGMATTADAQQRASIGKVEAGAMYSNFIVKYRDGTQATADMAARNGRGGVPAGADATAPVDTVVRAVRGAAEAAIPVSRQGRRATLSHVRRLGTRADEVRVDRELDSVEAARFMREVASDPNVQYIEPVRYYRAYQDANDPEYRRQWHLLDSAAGARVAPAWGTSDGDGVVVAVVDTGIVAHRDLDANVLPGYDMISSVNGHSASVCGRIGLTAGCGRSDDGDGRDANPTDASDNLHGVHVAGAVAAVTNNGIGVAGVAPRAGIVPIRVLGKDGLGSNADIADAIVWAAGLQVGNLPLNRNPAEVINLSLGGESPCSAADQDAINLALRAGAIVVVAAGNDNIDVSLASPANCAGVIAVASSNARGARAIYSNYGNGIDITAPGGETWSCSNGYFPLGLRPSQWTSRLCGTQLRHEEQGVLSTVGGNGYGFNAGTSMAAPHVAGIVALMQAAAPTPLTSAQVQTILSQTARPIAAANCPGGCGPGLVDAAAAVTRAAGGTTTPPVTPTVQTYRNTTAVAIPDRSSVISAISVSGRSGNAPSNAVVTVDITHPYRQDLRVELLAPDGSVYLLHNYSGGSAQNLQLNVTVNLSSELLNGTWRLRVTDNARRDTGRLLGWTLRF